MKKLWRRYAERIDAMTLRERLIMFCAAVTLLVVFVYSLWIDSDFVQSKRLSAEIAQHQAETNALQQQIGKIGTMRDADPDRPNRERLARRKAELASIDTRILAEERKFTAPDKMRAVLGELLGRNPRVRLLALRTLPVVSIAEARAAASAAASAAGKPPVTAERLIFRHGVELTVSGSYLDVLAYVAQLERLPTQLYWSDMGIEAQYPIVTMKVTVYTMSLDRAWMNV